MMSRKFLIANWKMNGDRVALKHLTAQYMEAFADERTTKVVLCAPFVYLDMVACSLKESELSIGAQDISSQKSGSYTGDISAQMLRDVGCEYVIIGHSERREHHNESDQKIAEKLKIALEFQLMPVLCVGEQLEDRNNKTHLKVIKQQIESVNITAPIIIAYEPLWAIGTGIIPKVEEIEEMIAFIKSLGKFPVLYGGSVNKNNAEDISKALGLDGFLVGAASLKFDEFFTIYQAF